MDSGNAEYYINRLIQRAIVEPKPLLKIYEEECQRHPNISITVTFKGFEAALQQYCMTHPQRNQNHIAALLYKQQDVNRSNKEPNGGRFVSMGDFVDQGRKRRRFDGQSQSYQRIPQPLLGRFSPQSANMNNKYCRNGVQQPPAQITNIKSEEPTYTSTSTSQPPTHSLSRPPSVQPPIEEEPPPEFIEMSSNPPLIPGNSQFPGLYHAPVSNELNITPAGGSACKKEPKESDSGGAVQSSSPLDKNITLLCTEDVSPLNVRCVKCITALVTCAVMPCGHCCLCNICGQTALSLKQVCPVCRKSISTVIGYSNLIYNVYR